MYTNVWNLHNLDESPQSQRNERLVNQKKVTCQQCHACFYFWKSLNVAPAWCFFWACFVIVNLANMFIIVEFQPLHLHFFIFFKTHEKHKKLNPQDYVWGHSKPQSVYVTVYSFLGPRPCRLLRRTCPVLGFFFFKLSVSPTKQQQKTPSKCAESYSTAHDIIYIHISISMYVYIHFLAPKVNLSKNSSSCPSLMKKSKKNAKNAIFWVSTLPSRFYATNLLHLLVAQVRWQVG